MRRGTRGIILNLVLFGLALFFLIYPNSSRSNNQPFAWTTIRYETTSAGLPEARGICPGLERSQKPALVVARLSTENSSWLDPLSDAYHLCVYTVDAPTDTTSVHLQVPANRGHEAVVYSTFLIDNYAHIPTAGVVFVHGSRWAWHNDDPNYDNAALLAALNISAALEPQGYHNLRCDWSASTCITAETPPQGSVETYARGIFEPWNTRVASDKALPRALAALFSGDASGKSSSGKVFIGRFDALRSQCCAQFVVSRHRIWQHSQDEYVALRQWLLDRPSGKSNGAPRDDRIAGRVLSYVWHVLFMPLDQVGSNDGVDLERLNALACPHASDCYCRLYGRCNLEGCTSPGRCTGQYRVPPNFKLPDDWPATHS